MRKLLPAKQAAASEQANPLEAIPHSSTDQPHTTPPQAPSKWLAPFDRHDQGRRLGDLEERLQADADLVWRLALSGYQGAEWNLVAETLVGYGWRVLTAWILDGTIRKKCLDKGWAGPWDTRCRSLDVAEDLATDTVTIAVSKFRDTVLIPGRWSPNGGASLRTFFIGQCLLRWANSYRSWKAHTDRQLPLPPPGWAANESQTTDPTVVVTDRMHVDDLLPAGSIERRIFLLRDAGYGWDEIAALTGQSVPSLRGVVRRLHNNQAPRRPHDRSH